MGEKRFFDLKLHFGKDASRLREGCSDLGRMPEVSTAGLFLGRTRVGTHHAPRRRPKRRCWRSFPAVSRDLAPASFSSQLAKLGSTQFEVFSEPFNIQFETVRDIRIWLLVKTRVSTRLRDLVSKSYRNLQKKKKERKKKIKFPFEFCLCATPTEYSVDM